MVRVMRVQRVKCDPCGVVKVRLSNVEGNKCRVFFLKSWSLVVSFKSDLPKNLSLTKETAPSSHRSGGRSDSQPSGSALL